MSQLFFSTSHMFSTFFSMCASNPNLFSMLFFFIFYLILYSFAVITITCAFIWRNLWIFVVPQHSFFLIFFLTLQLYSHLLSHKKVRTHYSRFLQNHFVYACSVYTNWNIFEKIPCTVTFIWKCSLECKDPYIWIFPAFHSMRCCCFPFFF